MSKTQREDFQLATTEDYDMAMDSSGTLSRVTDCFEAGCRAHGLPMLCVLCRFMLDSVIPVPG